MPLTCYANLCFFFSSPSFPISNSCNRNTGQCECFHNYAGFSCSQQTVYI
jgi:hypothetical protein